MAKLKKEQAAFTPEDLRSSIKSFNRGEVLKILKSKCFTLDSLDDQDEIYQQLIALRDMSIMDCISSQMEYFYVDMFDVDLSNGRNRDFIDQVLTKYYRKFSLDDPTIADKVFDLSCNVGNEKIPAILMKKNATTEQYVKLAASSNSTFQLLLNVKPSTIDGETLVSIMYHAALCENGQTRLKDLFEAGYDINSINDNDETITDLLEKRVNSFTYPSNKKGNQQKLADKNTLQFLHHELKRDKDAEHSKKIKIIGSCVIGAIILVVVIITFSIWYTNKTSSDDSSDSTTTDSSTTDTSSTDDSSSTTLNTDASLTVADGDTVNIDYTGYIDGEAFDGGSTDGAGADLTIGSGTYMDGFEDQLIGCSVGSTVDVNVTFPEDYGVDSLNGKDATFTVTINGIYQ